jgi:hypothetical protein
VRWALVGGAAALVGAPLLLWGWVRTPYVTGQLRPLEQPVPFDHRHHVGDDAIDCRYCHDSVDRSPDAGVPASAVCMNCHNQVWNESPLLEPVRRSFFQGIPIAWVRVHRLPDFVFFDHSIHVAKGVGCEECHGRVDRMARISQVAPLTMGWCLDCHRDPGPHLRPPSAVTEMGWTPEGSRQTLGRELVARHDVRPGTNCSTCHR